MMFPKITEEFLPKENTSTQSSNTSAKYVNRSDLAEPCERLTEDCDYQATLNFFNNFEVWYVAAFPGCSDLNRKKTELHKKLSRHLKTELVNFNTSTNNFEGLKKAQFLPPKKLFWETKDEWLCNFASNPIHNSIKALKASKNE